MRYSMLGLRQRRSPFAVAYGVLTVVGDDWRGWTLPGSTGVTRRDGPTAFSMPKPPALTNLQRELLRIGALELPDEELKEVKLLLARYFAQKASGEFESFARERGLSPEETDTWAFEHFRKRVPAVERTIDPGRDRGPQS